MVHIATEATPEAKREGRIIRIGAPVDERIRQDEDLLLETHVERRSEALRAEKETLELERGDVSKRVSKAHRVARAIEWSQALLEELPVLSEDLGALLALEQKSLEYPRRLDVLKEDEEYWRNALIAARDVIAVQERARKARADVDVRRNRLRAADGALKVEREQRASDQAKAKQSAATGWMMRKLKGLEAPDVLRARVGASARRISGLEAERAAAERTLAASMLVSKELEADLASFDATYEDTPNAVATRAAAHRSQIGGASAAVAQIQQKATTAREVLQRCLLEHRTEAVSVGPCVFDGHGRVGSWSTSGGALARPTHNPRPGS